MGKKFCQKILDEIIPANAAKKWTKIIQVVPLFQLR